MMCFNFGTLYIFLIYVLLFFQVSNMLQVAQNYQSIANKNGPAGVSNDDARNTCNMLVNLEWKKKVFDSL